ncbi:MAG: ABC transporter substrate-binding protein [Ruminiclostridium sp.]
MYKKVSAILLSMCLIIAAFTGCGSSSTSSEGSASVSGSPAATSAEKVKLTMLSTTIVEQPDGIIEQEILDDYLAKKPNVEIEMLSCSANDIMTKLTAMITAENSPDIFSNFYQYMAGLKDMNALAPLNEYFGEAYIKDLMPAVVPETTLDGNLYIIPWGSIPTLFVYRTDWLKETGLDIPKTFDDVTKVCKAMTKDTDGDGVPNRYGLALIASNNSSAVQRFTPMLRNSGAAELVKDANGNYSTQINSAGAISILSYFYNWANVDKIVPPGAGEIDHKTAINLLATEQAGAVFSGPHTIASVIAQNPALKGKFAGALMPTLKAGDKSMTSATVNGISVSAQCKNKEQAVDYIKFLTNAENFAKYNAATYRIPPTRTLQNSVAGDPNFEAFAKSLENFYPVENVTFMSDIQAILAEALNIAATGADKDINAVAKNAETKINKIIEKNKK